MSNIDINKEFKNILSNNNKENKKKKKNIYNKKKKIIRINYFNKNLNMNQFSIKIIKK